MFRFLVQVYPFIVIYGFLTENTNNGGPDVLKDVLELMVDEKNLRHQLETAVMQLKQEVDTLKQNQTDQIIIMQLKNEVDELRRNQNNRTSINQLKHEVDELRQNLSSRDSEVTKLKETCSALQMQMQSVQNNRSQCQCNASNVSVGFTARFSQAETISPNDILIFSSILYQTDNSYNPSTGIFTCPRRGLYLFSVSLSSQKDEPGKKWAILQHNDNDLLYINSGDAANDRGLGDIIIHLNAGDKVKVMSQAAGSYRNDSYFIGVLISHV